MGQQLLALGAESVIRRIQMWGRDIAVKHRPEKPYLLKAIDESLRTMRTSRECKIMTVARSLGVRTPSIYSVDLVSKSIVMDYIEGEQMKLKANDASEDDLRLMCEQFGRILGLLHLGDVVHGDPTTSNVIIDKNGEMWMIDFGLAEMNATVEMKGVDLHLVRRAFETTHWDHQNIMLSATLDGYSHTVGDLAAPILDRMHAIRERGRYH